MLCRRCPDQRKPVSDCGAAEQKGPENSSKNDDGVSKEFFDQDLYALDEIGARSMLVLDPDRKVAIEKISKVEELLKILPGIDCAACGSPSCRALAEDIVQGKAEPSWCIFLQELYIRDHRLSLEQADEINSRIWGKDRDYRSQSK